MTAINNIFVRFNRCAFFASLKKFVAEITNKRADCAVFVCLLNVCVCE